MSWIWLSQPPSRICFANFSPVAIAFVSELSSHSQTTHTRHPRACKACTILVSRATLRPNFSSQNVMLLRGVVADLQPVCRCQKQPWTKIAVLYRGKTKSGVPGNPLACNRNRSPTLCRTRRKAISGEVFLVRILDMSAERW